MSERVGRMSAPCATPHTPALCNAWPGMLDASLTRILTLQFLAGRFDPLEGQTYTELTFDEVDAASSRVLAAEGAQQGMVSLLRRCLQCASPLPAVNIRSIVGFAAQ